MADRARTEHFRLDDMINSAVTPGRSGHVLRVSSSHFASPPQVLPLGTPNRRLRPPWLSCPGLDGFVALMDCRAFLGCGAPLKGQPHQQTLVPPREIMSLHAWTRC